jgi:anti-anti-sigma regulatory factor
VKGPKVPGIRSADIATITARNAAGRLGNLKAEPGDGPADTSGIRHRDPGALADRFRVPLRADTTVVTAPAVLDSSNAQEFWLALARMSAEYKIVVADLSTTRQCDPRALASLVMALRYTDARGGEIRVVLGEQLRVVFDQAALRPLFGVFGSLVAALNPERGAPDPAVEAGIRPPTAARAAQTEIVGNMTRKRPTAGHRGVAASAVYGWPWLIHSAVHGISRLSRRTLPRRFPSK